MHHQSLVRRAGLIAAAATTLVAVGCGSAATAPARRSGSAANPSLRAGAVGPALHVTSDDDSQAALALATMIRQHPETGFAIINLEGDRVGVSRKGAKFLLQPRMRGPGEINRIIVMQLYAVKDEFRGREQQLKDVCYQINSTYDFITTYLQPAFVTTLFVAQSQLTFGDDLSLGFLGKYLEELKRATLQVAARTLVAYLK
ncbi:MAG TPA: hypothetical protein VGQ83_14835 [Polyangia bacterium]|jgi:hypothetical protein